jgi:hypothetical protein
VRRGEHDGRRRGWVIVVVPMGPKPSSSAPLVTKLDWRAGKGTLTRSRSAAPACCGRSGNALGRALRVRHKPLGVGAPRLLCRRETALAPRQRFSTIHQRRTRTLASEQSFEPNRSAEIFSECKPCFHLRISAIKASRRGPGGGTAVLMCAEAPQAALLCREGSWLICRARLSWAFDASPPISIRRGLSCSGTSRTRSIESSPFSRLAAAILT